jgi:hypothetical protein
MEKMSDEEFEAEQRKFTRYHNMLEWPLIVFFFIGIIAAALNVSIGGFTPVLYKDKYFNQKPFLETWEQARNALSHCDKLVVIGYSFSPSDFTTKQLFLESFISDNLKELVVVNPNHNLVKVIKELCHFDGGVVWFSDLEDYLKTFSESVTLESEPVETSDANIPQDTSPQDAWLKCKTCGVEFPAKIRTAPRSFATTTITEYMTVCPNCHKHSYDKADFSLRKVPEPE